MERCQQLINSQPIISLSSHTEKQLLLVVLYEESVFTRYTNSHDVIDFALQTTILYCSMSHYLFFDINFEGISY